MSPEKPASHDEELSPAKDAAPESKRVRRTLLWQFGHPFTEELATGIASTLQVTYEKVRREVFGEGTRFLIPR